MMPEAKLLFNPESIAVIGASNSPGKWGYKMIEWPLAAGYRGTIHPVNPKEREVLGLKAYPSVLAIPEKIDLVAIGINKHYCQLTGSGGLPDLNCIHSTEGAGGDDIMKTICGR